MRIADLLLPKQTSLSGVPTCVFAGAGGAEVAELCALSRSVAASLDDLAGLGERFRRAVTPGRLARHLVWEAEKGDGMVSEGKDRPRESQTWGSRSRLAIDTTSSSSSTQPAMKRSLGSLLR